MIASNGVFMRSFVHQYLVVLCLGGALVGIAACSDKPRKLRAQPEEVGGAAVEPTELGGAGSTAPDEAPVGGEAPATGTGGAVNGAGGKASSGGTGFATAGTTAVGTAGSASNMPALAPLVTATQQPAGLTFVAGFNYFTDAVGRVRRLNLEDNSIEELGQVMVAQGNTQPPAFAVSGDSVYVAAAPSANTFTIVELPLAGGAPMPFATIPARASAIVADETDVYYSLNNAITRIDIATKTPTPLVTNQTLLSSLRIDATNAYWISGTTVATVPLSGGTPTPLATEQSQASLLAIDESHAFWSASASPLQASVVTLPLEGGAPLAIATGSRLLALSLGPDYAYFATLDGSVSKVPLDGGAPPVVMATAQATVRSITVDDTYVYWLTASGQILRLPL